MTSSKQKHRGSAAEPTRSSSTSTSAVPQVGLRGDLRRIHPPRRSLHRNQRLGFPAGRCFLAPVKKLLDEEAEFPAGDYLLSPAGMDWLKSSTKLENVFARPDKRVAHALRKAQSRGQPLKSFIFAVNLQVPGKDHHSAVFYFATEEPIPAGSLIHRFINGDDNFRNQRFKIVNQIVKGLWVVKAAVGNYSACLPGKALTCNYHRRSNYLEIDVNIGSSAVATAILRLALGYVTSVNIDMGFLAEAQTEEELPERLIGAVRVCQMEMSSAFVVEAPAPSRGIGSAKVNHGNDDDS